LEISREQGMQIAEHGRHTKKLASQTASGVLMLAAENIEKAAELHAAFLRGFSQPCCGPVSVARSAGADSWLQQTSHHSTSAPSLAALHTIFDYISIASAFLLHFR
jgi:hypothetical protein